VHDYLISFLLGIVEGVTEFLPISSTAHLRLSEHWLGIALDSDYWKMYSIVIQLGAILSLPVYFRERIIAFLRTFPRGSRGDRTFLTHPLSLTLIATAATAVPALILKKLIASNLESLTVIGVALIAGGVVMWLVEALHGRWEKTCQMDDMSLGQAIWVGLCQTLAAVFPGTSRSMATIAAGQLAGMSRTAALEFSFFISMPTMALAAGNELREWLKSGTIAVSSSEIITLAIGFVVSFIVAYASVAWLMSWVRRHGFVPFAIYRIVLGVIVLLALR
jgi:undecaprenyl-diphosphatase